MTDYLISNARIVNEGRQIEGDVLVRNGRIEQVGGAISAPDRAEVIDANGRTLLPGMIDSHVHCREPGLTHKADFVTESSAAVAGGVTSFIDMPNVKPPTTDNEAIIAKHAAAKGRAIANYGFHFGATNDNPEAVKTLDTSLVAAVKVFMGASTGRMLVDDDHALNEIFAHAPVPVITHCEDTPMIEAAEQRAREQYGDDVPIAEHVHIRSREACIVSSQKAIELAKRHGTRLQILHLSTAEELELFEPGPIAGKQITAEACIHHLFFDADDYAHKGTLIKCNPSIKTAADRDALWAAVADGRVDVIATDHAPHLREEKDAPYFKAPSGLPLLQQEVPSLVDHVKAGRLTIEQLVEKTAHNVVQRYDIAERGYIREGYWADLTLVDMNKPTIVDDEPVFSKCGWTPFAGHRFSNAIAATFVSGQLAYHEGKISQGCTGQALEYAR